MEPVHYVAHGTAMAFPCYHEAMRRHLQSAQVRPAISIPGRWSGPTTEYEIAAPRRHTDLGKVTCRFCWEQIGRLAAEKLRLASGSMVV